MRNIFVLFLLAILLSSCSDTKLDKFKFSNELILDGVVTSLPAKQNNQIEFIFHSYKYGDFLLKGSEHFSRYIEPANELELTVRIYKPENYDNINAFNYSE